jgi:hypothetical protein
MVMNSYLVDIFPAIIQNKKMEYLPTFGFDLHFVASKTAGSPHTPVGTAKILTKEPAQKVVF